MVDGDVVMIRTICCAPPAEDITMNELGALDALGGGVGVDAGEGIA